MNHHPPRRPPLRSATASSAFSRISTVSDFTDLDSFQDGPAGSAPQARPALSSLQTSGAGQEGYVYASPTSGWPALTGASSVGYSPVSSTDTAAPDSHGQTHARRHHDAIPEEDGADLSLVRSAVTIDGGETEKEGARVTSVLMFDLTNTLGPSTQADEAFLKALQEQEAHGKLTGGLGLGIKSDTTVTESALLAASPVRERPLSRSFSRLGRVPSRIETVKRLGQSEANKRGEVIEVVLDDAPQQSKVDISLVSGHGADDAAASVMRQTTFPTKKTAHALFYPQPNWKPFSMRWPFLLMLIVLSLVLAASVEVLYRSSTRTPLVAFRAPSEIPTSEYFAIKFLPMITAVSYGVLWQMTNFDVMRLEPFYQLSKESGALAAESINVDYLTQFNLFRPLRALHYRHYAVVVSSVASLLANTLVPTLGAASLFLSPDRETRLRFPDGEKHILVHHVWARLLTATLSVVALLGCVLFYQLQTRRSGLLADVKGIAGLASMATVSHILMDFKDMDVATHQDIHHKLKNHRYVLRNSSLAPDDRPAPPSAAAQDAAAREREDRYTRNHLSANPQPLMFRPQGALPFLALVLAFTALLPVVLFTPATALTDRAPWLVTAIAVVIKLSWGALETNVRLLEPYYILSRRHAPPKTLFLDYTTMPFGWVAVRGLLNRHWLVFAVGLGSVVAEVLTVLVTSLATVEGRVFIDILHHGPDMDGSGKGTPRHAGSSSSSSSSRINAGQETVPSFWASLALAVAMLLYLGIVGGIALARRGGTVFLPRQPNTIASVLAYIHQSKMLYKFVGTAKLRSADVARRLEQLGTTYGLGWFRGRDGHSHCGVDEEELLSGYKVGYDYSRATKPWEEGEVNWL